VALGAFVYAFGWPWRSELMGRKSDGGGTC
jgi:hypothetical protein